MVFWLLTREVLSLKGELQDGQFNELPDLFMYRNVEKKEENVVQENANEGDDYGVDDRDEDGAEEDFIGEGEDS
jgi:hypothetical protein